MEGRKLVIFFCFHFIIHNARFGQFPVVTDIRNNRVKYIVIYFQTMELLCLSELLGYHNQALYNSNWTIQS